MNEANSETSFELLELVPKQIDRRLLRVSMEEGESIVSVLARQCRLDEMCLKAMLKSLRCDASYGPRPDFDIEPEVSLLCGLSDALLIPMETLRKGTLDRILMIALSPTSRAANLGHNWRSRHLPWVLPNAWQYGKAPVGKSIGGIPYCPLCFADSGDPWFPIRHRLSTVLTCKKHRVWLRDDCPKCGCPVGPMTLIRGGDWSLGTNGPLCRGCLIASPQRKAYQTATLSLERPTNSELAFEEMISRAFEGEVVSVPGIGMLPPSQFLGGLRYVNTMASYFSDISPEPPSGGPLNLNTSPRMIPRSSAQPSLEFLPFKTRRQRLKWFRWICEAPLDRWHVLRKLMSGPNHLSKSWEHPWEGVREDGEYLRAGTWQYGSKMRTEEANLGQVKLFFEVTKKIGLSSRAESVLLGGNISSFECQVWSNIPSRRVPVECRHRMNHFLRIWTGLLNIFRDEGAAVRWLHEPSGIPKLKGQAPLEYLSRDGSGKGFEFVSRLIGRL